MARRRAGPLVVLPTEVGHAGGGWLACERGVAAVEVVMVQPVRERVAAGGVAEVDLGVGPLVEHGAVVALDLAVGLGPVGPGPLVGGAGLAQRRGEDPGAVAGAVVGQDPLDALDAGVGEERSGAAPEPGRGLLALVVEQLGVGQPGVVIDGVVQERVAGARPAVAFALFPAVNLVPATIGDVAELLDVDVHQITGSLVFVAAHDPPGGAVEMGQPGQSEAGQDLGTVDGAIPSRNPIRAGPQRRRTRTLMMRRSRRVGVRRGLWRGREDRSTMPSSPSSR